MLSSLHRPSDPRIFQKEARTLAQAGYEVTYVAAGAREEAAGGVRLHPFPRAGVRFARPLTSSMRMFREARKVGADIYHFHDPELIPAGLALKLLGRRVVYDAHEDMPKTVLWKPYLPPLLRRPLALAAGLVEKTASRAFDLVVVAGKGIERSFRGHPRTLLVRNYPIAEQFADRAIGDRPDRELVAVYAGGLTAVRGVVEMVTAIGLVDPRHHPRLVLCGNYYPESLAEQVRRLPGYRRVDDRGVVPYEAVPAILAQADVGLVCLHRTPNHLDSEPTKMFEYMAAGLPVIASNFPGWRDIVEANGCGLCVDPADPDAIAAALTYLAEHPERRADMGANGRRAVLERYNWEAEGRRLVEAYAALARRSV
jgi:glycosyltransferase involved in cell wall biosynthesis